MRVSLYSGVVCAELDSGPVILDTGSPVSLGDGSTYRLDGLACVGEVDDFHPLIGKFTSPLYEATVVFAGESISTKIGVLPKLFSMSMKPFGVTGILGTDVLAKGVLSLDLHNEVFDFVAHSNPQSVPHDSWASDYDALFDASFGLFLEHFTDLTIEAIESIVPASASVLDVGAGTGRLSIPLAIAGYAVTAVDPSSAMLEQLVSKLSGKEVRTVAAPIENFSSSDRFDIAVCVFTVSSYWLTEQQLRSSLRAIYDHLVPGGSLIIDRTSEAAFADTVIETDFVRRNAIVTPLGANMYRFTENSEVIDHDGTRTVCDSFEIRYWTEEQLLSVADAVGFLQAEDLSDRFVGSGASFYRLVKTS